MHTILIVEDNQELGAALASNLEVEGHRTLLAHDGARGLDLARASRPDLVILDLSLPGLDGLQVLGALRRDGLQMPVLVLTARSDEVDKVLGFRLGADDYVTKPFGLLELIARVSALLRRARPARTGALSEDEPPAGPARARFGDVVVDLAARTVERDGSDVAVPPKAFDLLAALIEARGAAVSRLDLLREVWGYSEEVTSRTVDSHVAELRRRLEPDPANPQHILTVRKAGYRLRVS